jgi:small-conductance mechanosensitive channel
VGEVSLTSPDLRSDLYRRMLKRFKEADIDIPFPQREVRVLASSAV